MEPTGYWYYLDGEHVCVNSAPCTRSQLPETARSVVGPYVQRAFVLGVVDNVAHTVVVTA